MESKTEISINRIDDDTIDMVTTATQKLTNQEFYDMWASKKTGAEHNKKMIENNKMQIQQAEAQNVVMDRQIEKMTKMAKDCEARIPSKPKE